jgi:hypothetical protein
MGRFFLMNFPAAFQNGLSEVIAFVQLAQLFLFIVVGAGAGDLDAPGRANRSIGDAARLLPPVRNRWFAVLSCFDGDLRRFSWPNRVGAKP